MSILSNYNLSSISGLLSPLSEGRLVAVNYFGEPFFQIGSSLVKISPESGDREAVGDFAETEIGSLGDYWTGESLKNAWEAANGSLGHESFLVPAIPFVLGGAFEVANLKRLSCGDAVDYYRQIREQVAGAVDGEQVVIEVKE